MSDYLVCAGPKVLLPGSDNPSPASIVIDKGSGKISDVRRGRHTLQDLGLTGSSVEWIDAGNNIVLPGLVESVLFHSFCFRS
jgi:allantoinase